MLYSEIEINVPSSDHNRLVPSNFLFINSASYSRLPFGKYDRFTSVGDGVAGLSLRPKWVHPENKKSRNNTVENVLIKVYGYFCDTALIFSEKNNYVIHNQFFFEEFQYIFDSAEHLI